jgi:uncharacterized membrane protein
MLRESGSAYCQSMVAAYMPATKGVEIDASAYLESWGEAEMQNSLTEYLRVRYTLDHTGKLVSKKVWSRKVNPRQVKQSEPLS